MAHADPRVRQLSERVWAYLPNWQRVEPTIGMILTDEGWVAVEGGNSPVHGDRAFRAMQRIRERPARYVINTHRHFDHVFGNQAFSAPVIASRRCRERFIENLRSDWAPQRVHRWLQEAMLANIPMLDPEDFEELELVPPALSFQERLFLDLDSTRLELFPLVGAHSDDHIAVYLPDERLLFLGDALYLREGPEGRFTQLLELLDHLAELEVQTLVAGHEAPYGRTTFHKLRTYGHELIRSVIAAIRSGAGEEEILKISFPKRYEKTSFLSAKTHRRLLRAAYRELAAGASC